MFIAFFFNAPATTEIYTLSLHDALPISTGSLAATSARRSAPPTCAPACLRMRSFAVPASPALKDRLEDRSEEHTSELQSHSDLVCRLLLEKKKKNSTKIKLQHTQQQVLP